MMKCSLGNVLKNSIIIIMFSWYLMNGMLLNVDALNYHHKLNCAIFVADDHCLYGARSNSWAELQTLLN